MTETDKQAAVRRSVFLAAEAVVVLYIVLDEIVAPLFRPLLKWLARLRFVIRLQYLVAALPPYLILGLLAFPLAFAEPAKIYALYLMSMGHFPGGIATMAAAYFVSLVIAERIYRAGREKLRTIVWFAKLVDWLTSIRSHLLAWARTTRVWAFSAKLKRHARAILAKLRLRLGTGQVPRI